MQELPHRYVVTATGVQDGDVELTSSPLPTLRSAPPIEFGGPGTRWSPETLIVAAVGDCFILTFRAIARASKLTWTSLDCHVTGTLDRIERTTRFTRFDVHAELTLPPVADIEQAERLLEKAERNCLITSSLNADVNLAIDVRVSSKVPDAA